MSNIRYSFKKQLKLIFQRLCYLAFGEKIKTKVVESHDLLFYRVEIAADLHRLYESENFKYSDENLSKKIIAEDI